MPHYTGRITVPGVVDRPLDVDIDLDNEVLSIRSEEGEIGRWDFHALPLRGRDVGFDISIDGEWGHLDTNDDGGFAIDLGLHSAPPRLRRLMLAKLAQRDDSAKA